MYQVQYSSFPFFIVTAKPLQQKMTTVKIQQPESPQEKTKKQSLFHNYQKHLLVTLKQILDHSKLNNSIAQEMWMIFLDCKSYSTRSIYEILFGNKYVNEINEILFQKFHFQKILNKYSYQQITIAQQYLRIMVLQCFENSKMEELLKFRRLNDKKKDNLKLFIEEFVEELREGKFQRRIPKGKKTQIQIHWNVNKSN